MTQTIRIPMTITTVEEVMTDVTLPVYRRHKTASFHYMVFSEKSCINVCEVNNHQHINEQDISLAFGNDTIPCNAADFYEALARVQEYFTTKSGIELHELKQEEAWIENMEDRRELMEEKANNQHY